MGTMEDTMQAVRDWVKSINRILAKQLGQDYLKKTGDASKVTTEFATYGSRALPASGEELDITLAKIKKYLSDMSDGMAFSRDYDNLTYKPIRSNYLLDHQATTEELTVGGYAHSDPNNALLVYGIGGPSTTANPRGKADFLRAFLVVCDKYNADTNNNYQEKYIQLGSTGSTARWTLYPSSYISMMNSGFSVDIKIPKGSWANIQVLRIPFYTSYANNK